MHANESAKSLAMRSLIPTSIAPSTATKLTKLTTPIEAKTKTKIKKSAPYKRDFGHHLQRHGIHTVQSSQHPDLEETLAALAVRRPSLSPSQFSDAAFEEFQHHNDMAWGEADMMAHVFPIISGPRAADEELGRNVVFGNLAPLTDGTIVPAAPDIYYGTYPGELARTVRGELGSHVMPSTMLDRPLAPNFFVELKGPSGDMAAGVRNVCYVGAIGARAMHSLQNYGEKDVQYDGQAYTYSATYQGGLLKLYAHHPTAPTGKGQRPEYHMTNIDAYAMTGSRDKFVEGATAFRNARDLARKHREGFIRAANAKASVSLNKETPRKRKPAVAFCQWRHDDEELQKSIADASEYDLKMAASLHVQE